MPKILVIEDDKQVLLSLSELLSVEGFQVNTAENGLKGIKSALDNQPDLVICDVMMPELDGYGVLKELRKHRTTVNTPFIFLTGLASRQDQRHGMNLGADDYLLKPFTLEEVLAAINTRLAKQASITQHYVAELKEAEERLNSLLFYDNVTRLPNRALLGQRFNWIEEVAGTHAPVTLLSISIDRFNRINESLGFIVGDNLLRLIGTRLQRLVADSDTVARIQAGQFAILLPSANKSQVNNLAKTVLAELAEPFDLEGQELFVTASLGIAFGPQDGVVLDTLLKNADVALNYVQERGGNFFHFYSAELSHNYIKQVTLQANLRQALQRDEFRVYYQPQISLSTGHVVGVEALIRWEHPERGLVLPGEFIPLAEETNLIGPMSEWVLSTACAHVKAWQEKGLTDLRVAVNLSGRQLTEENLREKVLQILQTTGLSPDNLELELTESVLLRDMGAAISTLSELRAIGIHVAIDDFGTGYSSLSQLRHLPFDTLKVDRSFVKNVGEKSETSAITAAIIQMAHTLNLLVIAEGVETIEELEFLRQTSCDEIQGFFVSRPLPGDQFLEFMTNYKPEAFLQKRTNIVK
jgi:diguanylate cyclase (GGDEF)-like protein